MLKRRAGEVLSGQSVDDLVDGLRGEFRVEFFDGGAQVTGQYNLGGVTASECAVGSEGFLIPGIDAVPAQHVVQMSGEGLLDQAVFAVDVGDGHWTLPISNSGRSLGIRRFVRPV